MVAKTKYFGEVDIEDEKILDFPGGIIGFENLKKFAIIYDSEKGDKGAISWLQSMEEPALALPVINPLCVMDVYNPIVEDELLKPIGNPADEDLLILLALTVPNDIEKMTANKKAPFIINSKARKGAQLIADNSDYEIKFNVYEAVEKMKERAGE